MNLETVVIEQADKVILLDALEGLISDITTSKSPQLNMNNAKLKALQNLRTYINEENCGNSLLGNSLVGSLLSIRSSIFDNKEKFKDSNKSFLNAVVMIVSNVSKKTETLGNERILFQAALSSLLNKMTYGTTNPNPSQSTPLGRLLRDAKEKQSQLEESKLKAESMISAGEDK